MQALVKSNFLPKLNSLKKEIKVTPELKVTYCVDCEKYRVLCSWQGQRKEMIQAKKMLINVTTIVHVHSNVRDSDQDISILALKII